MTTLAKLKNCPFCGEPNPNHGIFPLNDAPLHYAVDCECCGAMSGFGSSMDNAADKWNKRFLLDEIEGLPDKWEDPLLMPYGSHFANELRAIIKRQSE